MSAHALATTATRPIDVFPRRPALWAALALMGGILIHRSVPAAPICWTILLAIQVLAATVLFSRPVACSMLLFLATITPGLALAQIEAFRYPANHITAFAT